MDNKLLFSLYYKEDTGTQEDKEKFRLRILKYLEDIVNNKHLKYAIYYARRKTFGVDIHVSESE